MGVGAPGVWNSCVRTSGHATQGVWDSRVRGNLARLFGNRGGEGRRLASSRSLKVVRQADRCGHEGRWVLVRACVTVSMWADVRGERKKTTYRQRRVGRWRGEKRSMDRALTGSRLS